MPQPASQAAPPPSAPALQPGQGQAVSVVLPTYNELANIVPLVGEILERTSAAGFAVQVVVVDDDSQDGTQEALRQFFGQDARLKLVVRKHERGLATALWRGIQEATGPVVVTMDSDFNHHPRDLVRVLAALPGHDLVIGSRYVPGGGMNTSWLRYQLSHAFNIMLRLLLGLKTHDNLSGFLAAQKSLWLSFDPADIFQGYGDYAIRLLYRAQQRGLKITEVPVVYENRLGGDSKTRFLHHLGEYLATAWRLRREPRR
ncbi:MAG: glycosyltransferase [Desulfarculus sp.]|nr:glycosyltransferase [Desulfarculus sp.]